MPKYEIKEYQHREYAVGDVVTALATEGHMVCHLVTPSQPLWWLPDVYMHNTGPTPLRICQAVCVGMATFKEGQRPIFKFQRWLDDHEYDKITGFLKDS